MLTKNQTKVYGPKPIKGGGAGALIKATVRFDDQCGNGHNTFAITGEIYIPGSRDVEACGCIHKEIARAFPELAPLIKWHLCSTDGPMHYLTNTIYRASDRDCWGLRAGEVRQLRDGKTGLLAWQLVVVDEDGNSCDMPHQYVDGETQPTASVRMEYRPWNSIGEGKTRELDLARHAAIWPEATDEELTAPGLEERLKARLPALMAEFQSAVESLGLVW